MNRHSPSVVRSPITLLLCLAVLAVLMRSGLGVTPTAAQGPAPTQQRHVFPKRR